MKNFLAKSISLLALGTASLAFAASSESVEPKTVSNFSINRYLGVWYEIGSNPQSFSKGCVCTQATYSQSQDNQISVLNECRDESPQGKLRQARGKARFAGAPTEGKLEVSFFPLIWGDYWIVELAPDYSYSVVSNKEGSSLWILSRSPSMDESQIKAILTRAAANGINTKSFQLTQQEGCR